MDSLPEFTFKLLIYISDLADAVGKVLVLQEQFKDFSKMVDRLKPVLHEVKDKRLTGQGFSDSIMDAFHNLEAALRKALALSRSCEIGSVVLLLLKCPDILKQIESISREISFCLGALGLANVMFSDDIRARVIELRDVMQEVEFKAAVQTELIIRKLQNAFEDEHNNNQSSLQLLMEIYKATGASPASSFITHEIENIQKQKIELEEQKQQNEALYLEQIIAFLYQLDTCSSRGKGESEVSNGAMSIQVCPLTGLVIEDPVDIASGCTFERRAIQQWFESGNTSCPVTNLTLTNYEMQSNLTLLKSIQEWKERMAECKLQKAVKILYTMDKSQVVMCLSEIEVLIRKVSTDFSGDQVIPHLLSLPFLHKDMYVKSKVMKCLQILSSINVECKELIVEEDGIRLALECLAYDDPITQAQAAALLLELSADEKLCQNIGQAKNSIPNLVAATSSADECLASLARGVLMNMFAVNQDRTQICEANYFAPLLSTLKHGSMQDKVEMAVLLGQTLLTEYSRAMLVQEGVLPPLVDLISETSSTVNAAVLMAIQNLLEHSNEARVAILGMGVAKLLLDLLLSRELMRDSTRHELASAILAFLVMPFLHGEEDPDLCRSTMLPFLQEEETVRGLIILLATPNSPPSFKAHILVLLLAAATARITEASKAREVMHHAEAIQLLLSFSDESDTALRLHSFKLLSILTEVDNGHLQLVDHMEENHVRSFVSALSEPDVELVMAVLGILSRFPVDDSRIMGLMRSEALPKIMEMLNGEDFRPLREIDRLVENALGVFVLFVESPSPSFLERLIQVRPMDVLVKILGNDRPLARQRAARALARLSENTMRLSRPARQSRVMSFVLCCFLGGQATHNKHGCAVHGKMCSADESFCLVKADAIRPLVKALGERECGADAAALRALETILSVGDGTWGSGMKAIEDVGGVAAIIRLLTTGSRQAREGVLALLVKLTSDMEYRAMIGDAEKCELIQLMQQQPGSPSVRKSAAKILGNVGTITGQSSYF